VTPYLHASVFARTESTLYRVAPGTVAAPTYRSNRADRGHVHDDGPTTRSGSVVAQFDQVAIGVVHVDGLAHTLRAEARRRARYDVE